MIKLLYRLNRELVRAQHVHDMHEKCNPNLVAYL